MTYQKRRVEDTIKHGLDKKFFLFKTQEAFIHQRPTSPLNMVQRENFLPMASKETNP